MCVLSACLLQDSEPSYGRVLDCCKEAIERVPGSIKAHYRCGVALFHLGRYDDAVSSLQKAAQLQGKSGMYIAVLIIYNKAVDCIGISVKWSDAFWWR